MIRLILLFALNATLLFSQTYFMNIKMKVGGTTSIPIQDIQKLTFSNVNGVNDERWTTVIKTFTLLQNFPNPFNPTTTISYQLPNAGDVEIRIFNIAGQLVKAFERKLQEQGNHEIIWDARNSHGETVATGVYVYQVSFENSVLTKKMLLIK